MSHPPRPHDEKPPTLATILLALLGGVVGLCLGELGVGWLASGSEQLGPETASQASTEAPSGRLPPPEPARTGYRQHESEQPGRPPTVPVSPPGADVRPPAPSAADARIRTGIVGNMVRAMGDYSQASARGGTERARASQELTKRLMPKVIEDLVQRIERRKLLGVSPWWGEEFQIVSPVGSGLQLRSVIGRGFMPAASPADSVAWYEQRNGFDASATAREEAIAVLDAYQRDRKRLVAQIVERVASAPARVEPLTDVGAYAIVDRRLFLMRTADVAGLAEVIESAGGLGARLIADAKDLLR